MITDLKKGKSFLNSRLIYIPSYLLYPSVSLQSSIYLCISLYPLHIHLSVKPIFQFLYFLYHLHLCIPAVSLSIPSCIPCISCIHLYVSISLCSISVPASTMYPSLLSTFTVSLYPLSPSVLFIFTVSLYPLYPSVLFIFTVFSILLYPCNLCIPLYLLYPCI